MFTSFRVDDHFAMHKRQQNVNDYFGFQRLKLPRKLGSDLDEPAIFTDRQGF
jgi:hypothetical protein